MEDIIQVVFVLKFLVNLKQSENGKKKHKKTTYFLCKSHERQTDATVLDEETVEDIQVFVLKFLVNLPKQSGNLEKQLNCRHFLERRMQRMSLTNTKFLSP